MIDIATVMSARSRLKSNSAPGGAIPMVAEMLLSLPVVIVYIIYILFANRYHALVSAEAVEGWKQVIVVFLGKTINPDRMNAFRGISLLCVSIL